jgi:hypothetical protein
LNFDAPGLEPLERGRCRANLHHARPLSTSRALVVSQFEIGTSLTGVEK